jgi:hypothetical protein
MVSTINPALWYRVNPKNNIYVLYGRFLQSLEKVNFSALLVFITLDALIGLMSRDGT